jgi:hypothetical protein
MALIKFDAECDTILKVIDKIRKKIFLIVQKSLQDMKKLFEKETSENKLNKLKNQNNKKLNNTNTDESKSPQSQLFQTSSKKSLLFMQNLNLIVEDLFLLLSFLLEKMV